jgi:hypothetical protein
VHYAVSFVVVVLDRDVCKDEEITIQYLAAATPGHGKRVRDKGGRGSRGKCKDDDISIQYLTAATPGGRSDRTPCPGTSVDERVSARNANTSWREEEEEEEEEMMRDANTSRQAMLQAQFDFLCSCAVCQGP